MNQITWGAGTGGFSDVDLSNRELIVRFAGFRRADDGSLLVKTSLAYGFVERDGVVYKRGTQTEPESRVSSEADCYQDKFFWRFEVIKPFEFGGEEVPHSTRMKGIVFPASVRIKFIVGPQKSGFIQTAEACGLNVSALDDTSELFSPDYFDPGWVESLVMPLSFEQVLLKLIEPKLLQLAEAGHVLRCMTNESSNWPKWDSFVALPREQAERILASRPEVRDEAAALREQIRRAVRAGEYTAVDVSLAATAVHPGINRGPGTPLLEQLDEGQLRAVIARLAPAPSL